jgi:hypothetical protein
MRYLVTIACPSPRSYPLADGDNYNDHLRGVTLDGAYQCLGCVYSVAGEFAALGNTPREQLADYGNTLAELLQANGF